MRFAMRDDTTTTCRFDRGLGGWLLGVLAFMVLLAPQSPAWGALPDVPPTGAYIEAEDYVSMGAANPWAWNVQSSVGGYQGTGYLYTTTGGTGTQPNGSRIDFPVNFTASGTYQMWLRARDQAGSGGGDSTFWGIDGQVIGALTEATDNTWSWTTGLQNGTNQTTISAGSHTINLWPREAGQHTDSIFIIRTGESLPGNISEGSTAGVPSGHSALDFSATGPGAGYIVIDDGQVVNGLSVDLKTSRTDGNDLVYDSDLSGLTYRALEEQSDGFNHFTVDSKWSTTYVGGDTPSQPPSSSGGTLSITGRGQDIWNTKDYFTYLYQGGMSGNFTIDVRVDSIQNTHTWSKAGIMVRQSLATTSRHAMVVVTPGQGVSFQRRKTDGATSLSTTNAGQSAPKWLRLQRSGSTFTAYRSDDGSSWTQVGSDTVTMSGSLFIGLAVTSHVAGSDCTATFDNFMVTDTAMGTSSGWTAVATPFDAAAAGWGDGEKGMALKSGSTFAVNTFTYSSCVDPSPSSINIPAGQSVSGSVVSLPTLYGSSGNVADFSYQIDGVGVTSPWNSAAIGTGSPQNVTLTVTGSDPDCGGATISASQTVSVDNTCQDSTPSTITIATGQSSGGSVDLRALYSTTGDVGSFTYKINGNAVGATWDSTSLIPVNTAGTVTLTVTGTDPNNDCPAKPDITVVASNTIYIDNRCTEVDPTVLFDDSPKYVAAGKQVAYTVTVYNNDGVICDPMNVNLSLVGDDNPTDFDVSTVTGGVQSIPARGSATWTLTVGAKDGVPEWQENNTTVRATVNSDPNGHAHAPVDAVTRTIVFLVSPITHNSATTKSTKWGGNWGTSEAGSKYGNFTCLTCHVKNSPNVKWMRETITTPDGSNWGGSGGDTVNVTFTDARDGSDDWGNDDPDGLDAAAYDSNGGPGRTSSVRSCEVCHSITLYHRYDTEADPDGGGPLTGQSDAGRRHFNDRDCTDCHRHDEGFTADCTNCHGNPPIDDTLGGPQGLADLPGATGSTTAGTHYKHAVVLKFPCTYCHANYRAPDQMPRLAGNGKYDINHTFDVFASPEPAAMAGHYTGQDGVSYEGVVTPAGQGTLTCENIYCHGGTDNMGGTNPQWNGNITCDACHGTSATNTPPGYSHTTHVGKMGIACSVCHGDLAGNTTQDNPGLAGHDGENVKGHVNGSVHIDLGKLTEAPYNNSNPRYRGATVWNSGLLAPSATYGTCTNIACHYNNETPIWNSGPANCTTCHNNNGNTGEQARANYGVTTDFTNAAPNTGNHDEHCDPAPGIDTLMINAFVNKCESCHGASANTGDHVGHMDFTTDFAGGFTYNSGDGSCANFCHKTDASPNDWGSTAALPCHYCHQPHEDGSGAYIGPTVVDPAGAGGGSTMAAGGYGSHLKATKGESLGGGTNWDAQCKKCHPYHEGGATVPLPPSNWTAASGTNSPVMGNDMQYVLGLQFPVTGGIHLGGTSTSGSNEADICWNCHGADTDINEWGYNADTNDIGGTFPYTQITDINSQTRGSYNYGYMYKNSNWTNATSAWVDSSGNGYYRKDGYQHSTETNPDYRLSRRISSVHSVNFGLGSNPGSSVAMNLDGSGNVTRTDSQTLETPDEIRCTYCHDVHDMNRAVIDVNAGITETNTGRPYLRGSWMGNPYAPDLPPLNSYSYPTSGNFHGRGQRFARNGSSTVVMTFGKPRLFADKAIQSKGGYFIDQNSNWPASGRTLDETAGICVLCHGSDVNNMDYYSASMWRGDQVNGHANAALGGSGAGHANARNLFDARRGGGDFYMAAQDGVNYFEYGDRTSVKNNGPWRSEFNEAAKGGGANSPPRNTGWYGGTIGSTSRGGQYGTWYSSSGIGTNGSTSRAHDFTCSKCHSPHATGLPALLLTNCLDVDTANWNKSANNGTVGPNSSTTHGRRSANNCHRKESTGSGWNRLAPAQ